MLEPPINEAKLLLLEVGQVVVKLKRWKAGWEELKDGEGVMNQGSPETESAIWWNGSSSPDLTKAPVVPVCNGKTGSQVLLGITETRRLFKYVTRRGFWKVITTNPEVLGPGL